MIYITGVSLNKNVNAQIKKCKDGFIGTDGISVCNITQNKGYPYFHLHWVEVIDFQIIHQGTKIVWGHLNKQNEIFWNALNPSYIKEILGLGPMSLHYLLTLLDVGYPYFRNYLDKPEEFLYTRKERWEPGTRNMVYGESVTRDVAPYRDSSAQLQNEFTLLIFEWEGKKEETIRRIFSYHGFTVID